MDTKHSPNEASPEASGNDNKTAQTMGRRELLKIVAATGGAVALSSLPNRWEKPLVEVGVLPAHAQASDTGNNTGGPAPTYGVLCDSEPGGGNYDLHLTHPSEIHAIRPQLVLVSGSGPVANINVTMTVSFVAGTATFSPVMPQLAVTDNTGVADFGNITVSGDNSTTQFNLLFNYAVPSGTVSNTQCGLFDHS
jgi:hypothetical protein